MVKLQAMMHKSELLWKAFTPKSFISKCFFKTSSSKIYSKSNLLQGLFIVDLRYVSCRLATLLKFTPFLEVFRRVFLVFAINHFSKHVPLCWKIELHESHDVKSEWNGPHPISIFLHWVSLNVKYLLEKNLNISTERTLRGVC